MALKHLLLGIISLLGPCSGYDLHSTILKRGRPQLPQIYLALKEMTRENLVEFERVHSKDRPTKNVYSITKAGSAELKRWVEDNEDITPIYEPLTQKIWFARMGDKAAVINDLKAFVELRKAEVVYYDRLREIYAEKGKSKRISNNPVDRFYSEIALNYEVVRGKSDIEWAKNTIQSISKMDLSSLKIGVKKIVKKTKGKTEPSR